ncbi:MAG: phosphodiester glycosidase family protein [Bacteroidia bacterium]
MGNSFNNALDNAITVCWRLLELPLFVLLSVLMLVFLALWLVIKKRYEKRGKNTKTAIVILLIAFFILSAALIADVKIVSTLNEVRELRSQMLLQQNDKVAATATSDLKSNYNIDNLNTVLQKKFGAIEIVSKPEHSSVDFMVLKIKEPLTHVYISVVDLTDKNLEVVITPELTEKWLTSAFAKQNNCVVAVNGEAGMNPRQGCGFGEWIGNWIVKGKTILLMDNDKRPFLSFDKNNHAKYFREELVDKTLTDEKYNTIWGRFDIILQGENLEREPGWQQPRTIMGIDKAGGKLFLMVVDGRQPAYSMGMGLKEAADILLALGCYEAMSCDQGGSACMYLKSTGGIVSRPSDDGRERFTYNHFGIKFNE